MTPETIFKLANALALIAWINLFAFPAQADRFILGIFITLLAILYSYLVFTEFRLDDLKSFGNLQDVSTLFKNEKVLLAGWAHYLAFDLMVGLWIKNNARKLGIRNMFAAPCLFYFLAWAHWPTTIPRR